MDMTTPPAAPKTPALPEGAVELAGGRVRWPLKWPFDATIPAKSKSEQPEQKQMDELILRRPRIKEITDAAKASQKDQTAAMYSLTALLADEPVAAIEQLDAEDFMEVQNIIEFFTPNSLKTGETSSAT